MGKTPYNYARNENAHGTYDQWMCNSCAQRTVSLPSRELTGAEAGTHTEMDINYTYKLYMDTHTQTHISSTASRSFDVVANLGELFSNYGANVCVNYVSFSGNLLVEALAAAAAGEFASSSHYAH